VKFPSLRSMSTDEMKARAALALWPRRDPALAGRLGYAPVPSAASICAVQAYRDGLCWSGYVDLAEWLGCTAPGVAALASAAQAGNDYARGLFEASEQPLEMPFPELEYAILRIAQDADQYRCAQDHCLLTLLTPQGRVWLRDFPDLAAPARAPLTQAALGLPVQAAWQLGRSYASRRLIGTLRRGDVVLIGTEIFELTSAGMAIGRFSINQDGEITVQAASMNTPKDAPEQEPGEMQDMQEMKVAMPVAAVAATLADVPLRLDFILQRRTLTVAELDALYQGQVLHLDPQAEKQVEITVNGMRLAVGELVELNGRLGVELHEVGGARALVGTQRVQ